MSARKTIFDDQHPRVLIVEDEPVLALLLEECLIETGFEIAGVTARLEAALAMIESGVCDAAILDGNLAGVDAGPAASALRAHGIPFVVLSGYSADQLSSAFSGALRLQKPCGMDRVVRALRSILPALPPPPVIPSAGEQTPV